MNLTTPKGKNVSAIYGTLKMIKHAIEKFEPDEVIVTWDSGKSVYRNNVYPEYKAHRNDKTPEELEAYKEFLKQAEELPRLLEWLGVRSVTLPGIEADDIMAAITVIRKDERIIVLTNDRDLLQLVDDNVSVYLPMYQIKPKPKDMLVTPKNFLEVTGVSTTKRFIEKKMLWGDGSDNINGVSGIGEKTAVLMVETWGYTVEEILELRPQEIVENKRYSRVLESKDLMKRNRKLMDISFAFRRTPVIADTKASLAEPVLCSLHSFKRYCNDNAFISILKEYNSWQLTFKSVQEE